MFKKTLIVCFLFAFLVVAFGQQARNWNGLGTLSTFTNFVAASGTSNVYSFNATKDVYTITATNSQNQNQFQWIVAVTNVNGLASNSISINGNPRTFGSLSPTSILVGSTTNDCATNIAAAYSTYPQNSISVVASNASIIIKADPYGSVTYSSSYTNSLGLPSHTTNTVARTGVPAGGGIYIAGRTMTAVSGFSSNPQNEFLAATNNARAITNLLTQLLLYPVSGVTFTQTTATAFTATANPFGTLVITNLSEAWAQITNNATTYTKDAFIQNQSDNMTIVVSGQAAGATTAALTFTFSPGVEDIAYSSGTIAMAVTLSGTTQVSAATNFATTWPGLKLVSVGVGAGANVTNYTVKYGSMK